MVKGREMRGENKGKKLYSPRVGMILNIDRIPYFIFPLLLKIPSDNIYYVKL